MTDLPSPPSSSGSNRSPRVLAGRTTSLGAALLALLVPIVAHSIPPTQGKQIFLDDYAGEVTTPPAGFGPTTPEFDFFELGGTVGNGFNFETTAFRFPVLTGTAARLSLPSYTGTENTVERLVVETAPLGRLTHNVRARYSGLTFPDSLFEGTFGVLSQVVEPGGGSETYVLSAAIEWDDLAGTASFVVQQEAFPSLPTTSQAVVVSTSADFLEGETFTIDLAVDRELGLLTGVLDIEGGMQSTVSLPLTAPSTFVSDLVLTAIASPGVPAQVDVHTFEAYIPYTSNYQVTSAADTVDALPGDGLCADAAGNCTLRAAIGESNTLAGMSRIDIDPLPGPITLTLAGADEDLGATGDLDILRGIDLVGRGSAETIVDGGDLDRLFHVPAAAQDTPVFLADLTLRNGAAGTGSGGAIESYGELFLDRCLITENEATVGGGLSNRRRMFVRDCIVRDNLALRAGGIAAPAVGYEGVDEVFDIQDSAVVENVATSPPLVGGLEAYSGTEVSLRNSTFGANDGVEVLLMDTDGELRHVTIEGGADVGLAVASLGTAFRVTTINTAIQGSAACSLTSAAEVSYLNLGHNAGNDLSCGFIGANSSQGSPLGLGPLSSWRGTLAYVPTAGSLLVDAAEDFRCLAANDQAGSNKPQDGDGDGSAVCDIGAIERVEPLGTLRSLEWTGVLDILEADLGTGAFTGGTVGVSVFDGYFLYPEVCGGDCVSMSDPGQGTIYALPPEVGGIVRGVGTSAASVRNQIQVVDELVADDSFAETATMLGLPLSEGDVLDAWRVGGQAFADGEPAGVAWSLIYVYSTTDPFTDSSYTPDPPPGADLIIFFLSEGDDPSVYSVLGATTSVPEPGVALGLVLGGAVLVAMQVRRRDARRQMRM